MKIPFVSGAYLDRSPNFDAEVCQNLYVNIDKEGGKEILSLFGIPGLKEWFLVQQFEGNLRFSGWLTQSWFAAGVDVNIYTLFGSGTNPTIVATYFNGTSLQYVGKYVGTSAGILNGLSMYGADLITIWNHGANAVIRNISATPDGSQLLPFMADYGILTAYDLPTAAGAGIIVDTVNDWIYIANNSGRIIKTNGLVSKLLRAFQGDLTTALDGSVLFYNYVYENYAWSYPRPASGGGGYWADVPDDVYDNPPLTTWGVGSIRTSHATQVSFTLHDGNVYLAQYDSPYSRLSRYNGTTLAYVCRKSDTAYGRGPLSYDGKIYTNHGLYDVNTVRVYDDLTLSLVTSRTGLSGGWGNMQIMNDKLILLTCNYVGSEGRIYKLNPSSLATVSSINFTRGYAFIKKIDETFAVVCSNHFIDIYNIEDMILVCSLDIRDYDILSAYNSTACAIKDM